MSWDALNAVYAAYRKGAAELKGGKHVDVLDLETRLRASIDCIKQAQGEVVNSNGEGAK